MLNGFPHIFVADTKIIYVCNFLVWSWLQVKDRIQFPEDSATFTEENLNENLLFFLQWMFQIMKYEGVFGVHLAYFVRICNISKIASFKNH